MNVSLILPRQQRHPWLRRPRPARYRALAEALPLEHPGEAWEELSQGLRELNFTACRARRRVRCMEPLRQSARILQGNLESRLTGERFPLSSEAEEYVNGAAEVWSCLSVGYLCALRDLNGSDGNLNHQIALRGLLCLGRLLLTCYHRYTAEPQGAWQAIHEFMADGMAHGPGMAPENLEDAPNATTAYKQLLVFTATGPLRLRQGEQAALYRVLADWVTQVTIRPLRDSEPKGPPIIFRPGEDESPRQYALDQMPDAPGLRLIDPAPLAARARRRLEKLESGGTRQSGEALDGDTLRVLLTAWSGEPARRFPRAEGDYATSVAVGFESAWRALGGEERPSLRCQIADRSSAGFRAILERAPAGLIQVGDLVVAEDRDRWIVGVVRWLRHGDGQTIQMGVEAVARRPQSVVVRLASGDDCPAILIEENRAAHRPTSLITPRMPFRENETVRVDRSDRILKLGRLVESTGSVHRFRLEDVNG